MGDFTDADRERLVRLETKFDDFLEQHHREDLGVRITALETWRTKTVATVGVVAAAIGGATSAIAHPLLAALGAVGHS